MSTLRYRSVIPLIVVLCACMSVKAQALPLEVRQKIIETVVRVHPLDSKTSEISRSFGSGTIVDPSGLILTNYHVIGDIDTRTHGEWYAVFVTRANATDMEPELLYWAKYVASDPSTDLALIRIAAYADDTPVPADKTFPSIALGDSNTLTPGDTFTVVGYPAFSGTTITFTSGTMGGWLGEDQLSGGKAWIKTDARISGGNSGGAVFDAQGRLIGIPTMIAQSRGPNKPRVEEAFVRPSNLAWGLLGPYIPRVPVPPGEDGPLERNLREYTEYIDTYLTGSYVLRQEDTNGDTQADIAHYDTNSDGIADAMRFSSKSDGYFDAVSWSNANEEVTFWDSDLDNLLDAVTIKTDSGTFQGADPESDSVYTSPGQ